MKTLLKTVADIEGEAQRLVQAAKENAKQSVTTFRAQEQQALDQVRRATDAKGKALAAELIEQAKNEANTIRQQEETTVQNIYTTAEAQREQAVEMAVALLRQEDLE